MGLYTVQHQLHHLVLTKTKVLYLVLIHLQMYPVVILITAVIFLNIVIK